jgi:AraC-like DNA-binding protein
VDGARKVLAPQHSANAEAILITGRAVHAGGTSPKYSCRGSVGRLPNIVGYQNLFSFSRAFRNHFGYAPNTLRLTPSAEETGRGD